MKSPIAKKLLRWYASRQRSLPWREHPEPYSVWVAEIMAQQTRLESMLPYFDRWMRRFPNVGALAKASEQEALTMWEGLGYYSRARNLRKAAQMIVAEHDGKLPRDVTELRALPGIGRYTAGAIVSLAYGQDEPAVDGNAIRVLSRVFDVDLPADSSSAKNRFWQLAAQHLPPGRAAEYNQALMDLGAEVCVPRMPKCGDCPLREDCRALALGIQVLRPVKAVVKPIPTRKFAAAVILRRGKVLLLQRPTNGLLGGMWEFPNVELTSTKRPKDKLRRALKANLGVEFQLKDLNGEYEHVYSHFRAHLQTYDTALTGTRSKVASQQAHRWQSIRKLSDLPMGKLDRFVANALVELNEQKNSAHN